MLLMPQSIAVHRQLHGGDVANTLEVELRETATIINPEVQSEDAAISKGEDATSSKVVVDKAEVYNCWITLPFWLLPLCFVLAEIASMATVQKTVAGWWTNNTFGSLEGCKGQMIKVHVLVSIVFWLLGAEQVFMKDWRQGHLAIVHRAAGYVFILLFVLIVGPTSFYLSLCLRGKYGGLLVSCMLIDVTVLSYYFFWRALQVARHRRRGSASLANHGRLMKCGLLMTMFQVPQRALMSGLLVIKKMLLSFRDVFDSYSTVDSSSGSPLDVLILSDQSVYTISMAYYSIVILTIGGSCSHLVIGPRSVLWADLIGAANHDEAYGSKEVGVFEAWAWRLRWLVYASAFVLSDAVCTCQ